VGSWYPRADGWTTTGHRRRAITAATLAMCWLTAMRSGR
jgi:hypothetical protein